MNERLIYGLPRLVDWVQNHLPTAESSWNISEHPDEQLDALLEHFCAGDPLCYTHQFRCLRPCQHGVWELKTADLRLFGWFTRQDCFIGSACNTTEIIKQHNLYNGYIDEAVRKREALDLDEPKFVDGDNPHDVVSNCYFP